jgi:predicted alpha/beta superfamily hydrolase
MIRLQWKDHCPYQPSISSIASLMVQLSPVVKGSSSSGIDCQLNLAITVPLRPTMNFSQLLGILAKAAPSTFHPANASSLLFALESDLLRFSLPFEDTTRKVDVFIPTNCKEKKDLKVLYMHDGQMLFDSTTTWNKQEWGVDETMSMLLEKKQIRNCIIVGIWNGGKTRHADYMPQKPFESLSAGFRDSIYDAQRSNGQSVFQDETVQSDKYLQFIVAELKPFIDQTYATLSDQKNTFIAGSSMGGLVSMYAICEYPNVFGGAACLSTHWPGIFMVESNPIPDAFVQYLDNNLPDRKTRKIYFDYGTVALDSLYPPFQAKADEVMKKHGWKNKQWITLEFPGADHCESAWKARLDKPLGFLLK